MDSLKKYLVIFFGICVLLFTIYYLSVFLKRDFSPGKEVDPDTFKEIFRTSKDIVILMDVRSVSDDQLRRNILQCGVDFAGSSGFADKNVTYLSASDDGCISPSGSHPSSFCYDSLTDVLTIDIVSGSSTHYYANGMVVGVNGNYTLSSCSIKRS
ncbi:hypothetical protein HY990_01530 [Candidatus Micrarchaeota archaeon]|nr:hypothetical protein [Candidatus Micrarchaeota archaeon]